MYFFFMFFTTTFANTFDLKGSQSDFSLVIDARKISFSSPKKKLELEIKDCNLHLARALNAELLAINTTTEKKDDLVFRADGNLYYVGKKTKEGKLLTGMENRMRQFSREEKTACK